MIGHLTESRWVLGDDGCVIHRTLILYTKKVSLHVLKIVVSTPLCRSKPNMCGWCDGKITNMQTSVGSDIEGYYIKECM